MFLWMTSTETQSFPGFLITTFRSSLKWDAIVEFLLMLETPLYTAPCQELLSVLPRKLGDTFANNMLMLMSLTVRHNDILSDNQSELHTQLEASVVNYGLVPDPTIQQPGFDLPHCSWTLLNHFHMGQGSCCVISKLIMSVFSVDHMVDSCRNTRLDSGLQRLHQAVNSLNATLTKALVK